MLLNVGKCNVFIIYLAEEQGVVCPQAPAYIKSERGMPTEEHGTDKDGEEITIPSLSKV